MNNERPFRLIPAILKRIVLVVVVVNIAAPLMVLVMPAIFPRTEPSNPGAFDHSAEPATIAYRAGRDSLVDLMLPEGIGGTTVVDSLASDRVGEAHLDQARILILDRITSGREWLSAAEVEIHERGHLIDATYPARVARLIAAVAEPLPGTTAAKDPGQHFAEMGAQAWQLLESFDRDDICVDPRGMTLLDEERVPGMAGALVWFIPTWERVHGKPVDPDVKWLADSLSAPYSTQWRPIINAVEKRRLADGHFTPLPPLTKGAMLIKTQLDMVASGSIPERVVGWMLWPMGAVAQRFQG